MPTHADYVEMMRQALAITEPELDTTIGTTVRKMLDAVAEVAEEVSVDKYLLDYQYDIDTKAGADLEDFVRLFGFSRLPAKRSVGTITLERTDPAPQHIIIPASTQVASRTTPSVIFATVVPAVMVIGQSQVEVPIQAVVAGETGNVLANQIEQFVQAIAGITSFTNMVATTGGADAESDDALRERFKRTVFRNLAGTEAMFLGVALENPRVTQANVIGATKEWSEQVEIIGGNATSTVQDASYIYPDSETFGSDILGDDVFTPGVHYSFDANVPPSLYVIDEAEVPDGIYDLSFLYVPEASRNDPGANITNRIDVYVNGLDPQVASEARVFSDTFTFDEVTGSAHDLNKFERLDGSHPVLGNLFLRLSHAPITDPSTLNEITIGATTYQEDVDYFLVNDVSATGGSPKSLSGIEWITTANGATKSIPANGVAFTIEYIFNAVPRQIEAALRDWRLVSTDVHVHQARTIFLNLHLTAILQPGFAASSVLPELTYVLNDLVNNVGFNGVLQTSDILAAAHSVTGIDAIRFQTSADHATDYAIERISAAGTSLGYYAVDGRAIDVLTGDSEVLAVNNITLVQKAQNSYGTV